MPPSKTPNSSFDESRDDRLRRLLESWYELEDAGTTPAIEEFCRDAPDLEAKFRRLVERGDLGGAPRVSRDDLPFESLGDFRLLEPLGQGGVGDVYLAEQTSLSRLVALKVLRPDVARSVSARRRFLREAEITAALDHENIIPIYAVGEEHGQAFIAMARLDGPSLDALRRPEPREVATMGRALATALAEAHASGVVHRDVKPSNVVIHQGRPILLDFGLARQTDSPALTQTGAVPGTLTYMAPEQVAGDAHVDALSDVYSLGVTLYELLAGAPPFADDTTETLAHRILLDEPDPLRLDEKDRDLETIVMRAMAKERHLRFATAVDMAADLDRFLDGDEIESRRFGWRRRSLRWARRHRGAVAILAMLVVISLLAAGLTIRERRREARTFDAHMRDADARLVRDDLPAARTLLDAVASHRRADPRVATAWQRLRALTLIEDLEDRVFDLTFLRDPNAMVESLRRLDALDTDESSSPRIDIVRAFAFVGSGRPLPARELLDRSAGRRFPRASAALRCIIDENVADLSSPMLPDPGGASPDEIADDHAFAAVAFYVADRPISVVWEEMERGWRRDLSHYRIGYLRARLLHLMRHYRAALEAFGGLFRSGRYSRRARRSMARAAAAVGDLETARKIADELGADVDDREAVALEVDLALARGDDTTFRSLIDDAVERWPDDARFRLRLAKLLYLDDLPDEAIEEFEHAEATAKRSDERQRCRTGILWVEFREAVDRGRAKIVAGNREVLLRLRETVVDELRRSSHVETRSDLCLLAANVSGFLRHKDGFWRWADAALEEDPSNVAAIILYARNALKPFKPKNRAEATRDKADVVLPIRIPEARLHLARLVGRQQTFGTRRPSHGQTLEAHYTAAFLAFIAADDAVFVYHRAELDRLGGRSDWIVELDSLEP